MASARVSLPSCPGVCGWLPAATSTTCSIVRWRGASVGTRGERLAVVGARVCKTRRRNAIKVGADVDWRAGLAVLAMWPLSLAGGVGQVPGSMTVAW